jgi:hypothetical protein
MKPQRTLGQIYIFCALLFWPAHPGLAQELEPQRWRHLPIDTNFLSAAYIHNDADIASDPALRIEDATKSMDTLVLGYSRTFELMGKSAQIQVVQPWQDGSWKGTVNSEPAAISRQGLADTQVRFAIHLLGAPPLKGKEYVAYRAATEVETLVGVAISVQLPSGEYMDDKLINLGTNQYTLRPEIGIVHGRGRWSFETSGSLSLYTDNDSFFNGNRLELDPLLFVQTNVLYRLQPDMWVAAGAAYAIGGESTVNGVGNDDRKESILWGVAAGYSITQWLGMKLQYVRSDSQTDIGTDSDRYIVSLSTFW